MSISKAARRLDDLMTWSADDQALHVEDLMTWSADDQALYVEDRHWLGKTLQNDRADVLQRGRFPNRSGHAAGDKDLAVFSFPTQSSGEIAHRPNRGVAGTVSKTNLAECGIALRDTHTEAE